MAPSFFKSLRRKSRASFRTNQSTDTSSDGVGSSATTPSTGTMTPPSIAAQSDPALNHQLKPTTSQGSGPVVVPGPYTRPASSSQTSLTQRRSNPQMRPPVPSMPSPSQLQAEFSPQVQARPPLSSSSNRYSVSGMSGLGAPLAHPKQNLPVSKYAPRLTNLSDTTWVYQKIILVTGTIGDPEEHSLDGTLTVCKLDEDFPPISWPVCNSHFKALVYLKPGSNKLRFEFSSPKLANSGSSNPIHATFATIHMMPMLHAPPLQLAILLAKDSPETFDVMPARAEREGNTLELAIRKFRMAAYLWQAFTAEQMRRNKLGRRTFRFEEEWTAGTACYDDQDNDRMRSEARVHIIRSDKTVAELRDLNKAQQYGPATEKNALFDITREAVKRHFHAYHGDNLYVAVLLLDAHWDTTNQTVTGHAALGGGDSMLNLGIFGSHCLQSYPSTFEEVVPAFTDCTPTDTNYVANDCGDAGSSWEAANIGIGAHLHEVGHLFGCPHQESGIMMRDYVVFNRSFVAREAYSTRTRSKGGLCLQGDECGWHRLDLLRFRAHPAFRLPNDGPGNPDKSVQAFPTGGGNMTIVAATGVSFIEIFGEGDDVCHKWQEYPLDGPSSRAITVHKTELRCRLPQAQQKGRVRLYIKAHGGGSLQIDDLDSFTSKENTTKLSNGQIAFQSTTLGSPHSEAQEVMFDSAVGKKVMSRVVVYHGIAVDGLEFIYDDGSSQLFGKRGGDGVGSVFELDVRRGECISGFYIRCGCWIDAIAVLTNRGRKSPIYGSPRGGTIHNLIPPRGFDACGLRGHCGQWLDGISLLVAR